MAFAFFRKHQKIVMITMIVLMVVFLIPAAFQDFIGGRQKNPTIAATNIGKITLKDITAARQDMQILQQSDLGNGMGQLRARYGQPVPTVYEFAILMQNQDSTTAYALLLQEARNKGVIAGDAEVSALINQVQGANYQEFLMSVREGGISSESRVREAFRNWLTICNEAAIASYDVPPSDAELRRIFFDLSEKIDLRVVKISAEELAKKDTTVPPEEAIQRQFNEYANVLPGTFKDPYSYGFGYRRPPMAIVSYLYVSGRALTQAVHPTQEDVDQFYRDNRQMMISVPTAATGPASTPATTGSSAPATASAPVEPKETKVKLGSLTLSQARPHIVKQLTPRMVESKIDDLLGRAEQIESTVKDVPPNQTIYDVVVGQMIKSASDKLSAKIKNSIRAVPLDQAMDMLAEEAGLAKIAYPTGKHGNITMNPSTRVTIMVPQQGLTLQQALDEVSRQFPEWVKIERWVMIEGLDNVLVPVPQDKQYRNIFPLSARTSPLMSIQEMSKDEILGRSVTAPQQGIPLARLAFSQVLPPMQGQGMMKVGDKGPRMLVGDNEGLAGKLIFRLDRIDQSQAPAPAELTTDTKLRDQVILDLKTMQAMTRAEDIAKKLSEAAGKETLEKAAAAEGLESFETGMFPRKDGNLQTSEIPKLDIPAIVINNARDTTLDDLAIKTAFSLAPKDVEPTAQGYGVSGAEYFRLPAAKEVVVMQRIGFEPAVESQYSTIGRYLLAQRLMSNRQSASMMAWFALPNVQRRLEYKQEQ